MMYTIALIVAISAIGFMGADRLSVGYDLDIAAKELETTREQLKESMALTDIDLKISKELRKTVNIQTETIEILTRALEERK